MEHIHETSRLILREFDLQDAHALHTVFSDSNATRFNLRTHSEVSETESWIKSIRIGYKKRGFCPWAVVRKSDGLLLGYCGFGIIRLDHGIECEVGYRIIRSCWGHGYATEAVIACFKYAKTGLPHDKIVALIQPKNIASIRVAEKAGMMYHSDTIFENVNMMMYEINLDK